VVSTYPSGHFPLKIQNRQGKRLDCSYQEATSLAGFRRLLHEAVRMWIGWGERENSFLFSLLVVFLKRPKKEATASWWTEHMDDNVKEYSSLLGSGTINERWQSTSHGLKIALVVIAVLSVVALAFFIATIVLAAKGSDDTTTVLPCPVRLPLNYSTLFIKLRTFDY